MQTAMKLNCYLIRRVSQLGHRTRQSMTFIIILLLLFQASLFAITLGIYASSRRLQTMEIQTSSSPVHVLMGLSGDMPSFFLEVEVALKSLLLNAPLDTDLHLHIMADERAHDETIQMLERNNVQAWKTRNQVSIFVYNVQPFIDGWSKQVEKVWQDYGEKAKYPHTIGGYFRLFSHRVLPADVKHAVYMDSDVVIMADLQDLWKQFDDDKFFQWGENSRCSGFMLINVRKLDELWEHIVKIDVGKYDPKKRERTGDQAILRFIEDEFPPLAGTISREWDINGADGCISSCKGSKNFRRAANEEEVLLDIPAAGMLHLNGGKKYDAYFKVDKLMKYNHTFGLVNYYSNMPWNWAKYIVESKRKENIDYGVLVVQA